MVHTLHINRRQKVGLTVLFGLGLTVIVFEVLRLAESLKGSTLTVNTLWVSLEASVAIIVSSLPTYNVLIRRPRKRTRDAEMQARLTPSKNVKDTEIAASAKDSSSTYQYEEEIPMNMISQNS